MAPLRIRFVYDYVDPGSYLMHRSLAEGTSARGAEPIHHPFELNPPPRPLLDPLEPGWLRLQETMEEAARVMGTPMERPEIIPWSRKAHELALHAREKGCFAEVHDALFEAHFVRGEDIGRIDALVEIAVASGLDFSETRTVLDVDRHAGRVDELRREARERGVRGVPTLIVGEHWLEGFRDRESLLAFLEAARAGSAEGGG